MHPEWPLILFTFFLCVAGGALGAQGLLNVMGKGKKMQLASLVTALAALVVGGLSVFMHLQHWERIFNGFGTSPRASRWRSSAASCSRWCWCCTS